MLYYNIIINSVNKNTTTVKTDKNSPIDKNIVKAIVENSEIIQLSRTIESDWKHCGMYAFNREELKVYSKIKNKKELLEEFEDIEMNLFLNLGYTIKALKVSETIAVDTLEDIEKVNKKLGGFKNG